MSTSLHVGHHIIQTAADGVGAPIPAGTLSTTVSPAGIVNATVTPATNSIRLDGLAIGTATVTYAAAGYANAQDIVTVLAPPQIVITDGPEV